MLCILFEGLFVHSEPFMKKLDEYHVSFPFLSNNRQHMPVSAKMISAWIGKVFSFAKAHMSLGTLTGAAALVDGVFLVSILQAGDWARVSTPARHYFSTYITATDRHQDSVQCSVLGLVSS